MCGGGVGGGAEAADARPGRAGAPKPLSLPLSLRASRARPRPPLSPAGGGGMRRWAGAESRVQSGPGRLAPLFSHPPLCRRGPPARLPDSDGEGGR